VSQLPSMDEKEYLTCVAMISMMPGSCKDIEQLSKIVRSFLGIIFMLIMKVNL
jgi:hypothetical protein